MDIDIEINAMWLNPSDIYTFILFIYLPFSIYSLSSKIPGASYIKKNRPINMQILERDQELSFSTKCNSNTAL